MHTRSLQINLASNFQLLISSCFSEMDAKGYRLESYIVYLAWLAAPLKNFPKIIKYPTDQKIYVSQLKSQLH